MRGTHIAMTVLMILTLATRGGFGQAKTPSRSEDPIAFGEPLSSWMKTIRDKDLDKSDMAFEAIISLGPAAWRAVPELTKIVAAPFIPIQLGKDTRSEIQMKLLDINRRAGAVDALGAIGPAAASSAEDVIRWGLTLRMTAPDVPATRDRLYIDLVGIDILERMRVAGAVARFGPGASGVVQELVESSDNERRKLSAAILNEDTITIARDLMNSENCENRLLGLSLISAMWPVVAKEHLTNLKEVLSCPASELEKRDPPRGTIHATRSPLD